MTGLKNHRRNCFCEGGSVREAERTVKQRALHEVKEYFAISLYLFVVFSAFAFRRELLSASKTFRTLLTNFSLIR
jgi:hypothetical protein